MTRYNPFTRSPYRGGRAGYYRARWRSNFNDDYSMNDYHANTKLRFNYQARTHNIRNKYDRFNRNESRARQLGRSRMASYWAWRAQVAGNRTWNRDQRWNYASRQRHIARSKYRGDYTYFGE